MFTNPFTKVQYVMLMNKLTAVSKFYMDNMNAFTESYDIWKPFVTCILEQRKSISRFQRRYYLCLPSINLFYNRL